MADVVVTDPVGSTLVEFEPPVGYGTLVLGVTTGTEALELSQTQGAVTVTVTTAAALLEVTAAADDVG